MNSVINKIITKYINPNYKPKRRKKKKRGYIEISGSGYKDMGLTGIIMVIVLILILFLEILLTDETIKDIEAPLTIALILLIMSIPIYLYYCSKIFWFNDEEIIVKRFIRKNIICKYEDIIKVTDVKKHKIIIYTTKGKIKVDHELYNSKKILAKLEEKNIPIKEILIFEKMFPNAKI